MMLQAELTLYKAKKKNKTNKQPKKSLHLEVLIEKPNRR